MLVRMFECDHFTIRMKADPDELIAEVAEITRENDIGFKGDGRKGSFDTGVVKGEYRIEGSELTVKVRDRPYKVNCPHVESLLKDLFSCNRERDYRQIFGFLNLKRL